MEERTEKEKVAARIGIDLYKKRASGQITQEQFEKELAYWMLVDHFDTMKYMPMPTPPVEMYQYWELDVDRKKKVSAEFFKQEAVKNYVNDKYEAEQKNRHILEWLTDLLSKIPKDDVANREKVIDRIKGIRSKVQIDKGAI